MTEATTTLTRAGPYAVVLETQAVPELVKQLGWLGGIAG